MKLKQKINEKFWREREREKGREETLDLGFRGERERERS